MTHAISKSIENARNNPNVSGFTIFDLLLMTALTYNLGAKGLRWLSYTWNLGVAVMIFFRYFRNEKTCWFCM
jgi:hypothetical protein